MALGITLLVVGIIVVLLGFVLAAKNIESVAKNPFSMLNGIAEKGATTASPFSKHIGFMIVMACGSGSAMIGIVLIVVALVGKHAS